MLEFQCDSMFEGDVEIVEIGGSFEWLNFCGE